MALAPIPDFIMNGTEIIKQAAMPPMGALSGHVICLVGTAIGKAADIPYNEAIKLDDYAHAMQVLNTDNSYGGTLPAVTEYLLTRLRVSCYVIIIPDDEDASALELACVGSIDGVTGVATGLYKVPECTEQPTIIYVPSFNSLNLGQKLCLIADQVKAFPIIDGINTNKIAAAEQSSLYGGFGTVEEALHIPFPAGLYQLNGKGDGVAVIPSGARLVAALASVEMWQSPQNQLDNILDNTIPVGYNATSANSEHNFLNKHGVYTFCRNKHLGGIICVGNRAHSGKFSSKVGLELALARKIGDTSEIYKGQMLTKEQVESIVARLNSWIKVLKTQDGCIIDAKVVVTDKNTVDSYRSGSFFIALRYGDYSPLEHFQVTLAEDLTIVEKYVEELKGLTQ